MKEEIILAGFGGQGIMLIGKLLAYAGMKEGFEVSWMPSYGPEMRGGTANCIVKISTNRIASPLTSNPDSLIVMNLPSLEKFESYMNNTGSIYLNSSLIKENIVSKVNDVMKVPANDLAKDLGNSKVANMVMLGAYLAKKDFISIGIVKESLPKVLSARRHNLLLMNEQALDLGASISNV